MQTFLVSEILAFIHMGPLESVDLFIFHPIISVDFIVLLVCRLACWQNDLRHTAISPYSLYIQLFLMSTTNVLFLFPAFPLKFNRSSP